MDISKIQFGQLSQSKGIEQSFEDLDVNSDGVINEQDKSVASSEISKQIMQLLNSCDEDVELVEDADLTTEVNSPTSQKTIPSWVRKGANGVNSTKLRQAVTAASSIEEKGEIILDAIEYCVTHTTKDGKQIDIWNALLNTFTSNYMNKTGFAGFTAEQYQRFQELCSKMDKTNKNRMNPEMSNAKLQTQRMWNALNTVNDNITGDEAKQKLENGETIQTPVLCKNGIYANRSTISWASGKKEYLTHPWMQGSKIENDYVTIKTVNGQKIYSAPVLRYGELNLNEEQIEILSKYLLNSDGSVKNVSQDEFMRLCKNHPDLAEKLGVVQGEEAHKLAGYDDSGWTNAEFAFKNEQGEVSLFLSGATCHADFRAMYDSFVAIINAKNWFENLQ